MPEQTTCSPQNNGSSAMTSNTPDHENSPRETSPDGSFAEDQHAHEDTTLDAAHQGGATEGPYDAGVDAGGRSEDAGVPVEPVQPASSEDVYDGGPTAHVDATTTADDLSSEEREPYPIGATDAEPAPATEGPGGEEIVIDYGAHQEHDSASGDAEPPLTKPSPDADHHPYPPQALAEPTDTGAAAGGGIAAVAATGAAAGAATTTIDRDDTRTDTDRSDSARTGSDRTDFDRDADTAQRPVYVQAPTPPKKKGNRGFGVLVGVLATLVFGGLYFLALLVTPLVAGETVDYAAASTAIVTSAAFWVPVVVFFLAWVLLVVVLTRASWWGYVIGGFIVGLLTYAGALAGALIQNAYEVAPSQVPSFLLEQALTPAAVLAFIIAREVPIWFGVWVGKRGRVVRQRNIEAREEYDRVLEAGPAARA
jgi:hypothetical protein